MRKERIGSCTLYLADCLDVLPSLKSAKVELMLTDPPYDFSSTNATGGGIYKQRGIKSLERIKAGFGLKFDPVPFLQKTVGLMEKYNAYIFCNKRLIKKYITFAEESGLNWDELFWWKTNPVPAYNGHYLNDKEYIFFFKERGATFNKKLGYDFYRTVRMLPSRPKKNHPTEKPLEVITPPLLVSSSLGGVVLDPFMGSGTTGVAAVKNGRKFIGIEIRAEYFDMACKRMEEAVRNAK